MRVAALRASGERTEPDGDGRGGGLEEALQERTRRRAATQRVVAARQWSPQRRRGAPSREGHHQLPGLKISFSGSSGARDRLQTKSGKGKP